MGYTTIILICPRCGLRRSERIPNPPGKRGNALCKRKALCLFCFAKNRRQYE
jgi:hypothetical protein